MSSAYIFVLYHVRSWDGGWNLEDIGAHLFRFGDREATLTFRARSDSRVRFSEHFFLSIPALIFGSP